MAAFIRPSRRPGVMVWRRLNTTMFPTLIPAYERKKATINAPSSRYRGPRAAGTTVTAANATSNEKTYSRPSGKRLTSRAATSAPATPPAAPTDRMRPSTAGVNLRSCTAYSTNMDCTAATMKLQAPPTRAITLRYRFPNTHRMPSASSAKNRRRPAADGEGASGAPMSLSEISETRKVPALTVMAIGAPTAPISPPAIPGPAASADDELAPSLALASMRYCLSRRIVGTNDIQLTSKSTAATPAPKVMTKRIGRLSRPTTASTGTMPMRTNRTRFAVSMIGRRRTRSTQMPNSTPNSRYGTICRKRSTPSCSGPAPSTSTAVSGRASTVICVP